MLDWKPPHGPARAAHLRNLLHDCVGSPASDQGARLTDASWLLASAGEQDRLAAMVACGAYESAAALVVGAERPFLVSRGANGVCLASALFADGCEEATIEAATPALAMLAAHVAALLAEESKASAPRLPATGALPARLH